MSSERIDCSMINDYVYLGDGFCISKDLVLDSDDESYDSDDKVDKQRGTYEFYVEWMEETCYDIDQLIVTARYDEEEKKLLEPHFDKLKKLCDERLDEIERIEKMKCGAYVYFIELLKINKLDLLKTIHIEPYIYESFAGLIKRTHKRLLEEEEKKNKK